MQKSRRTIGAGEWIRRPLKLPHECLHLVVIQDLTGFDSRETAQSYDDCLLWIIG